ncbi:HemY protein [Humitalea rosea]|uniref:HemY protein n=1 Tax=Humitalea rosea TaxID=990373 RepID=A0A2W7JGA4_9PROT|nr:heme biosynthesis HemY N-terminal domain-containing protein [Humitalea rosea]PZW51103.1 HemY protein [Humitalea rosea]
MRRALGLLLIIAVALGLAWVLARLGGSVEVRVGDVWIGISLPILLVGLVVLFLVLHGMLRLVAALRAWPARRRARLALAARDRGDIAVTRTLLALAAGTGDVARAEARRARLALGDTPQTLLLAAEAARLDGQDGEATLAFRALSERGDARFLGLRGLLRQAMARGDWPEAQRLAREAEQAMPGAAWLRAERADLALRTKDWAEALALAPPETPRASLALAAAAVEPDPARAAALEAEAVTADPGFVPAVLAQARRLREAGEPRRARAMLERAWQKTPHPDVAALYLEDEADPLGRVKATEHLTHADAEGTEARLLLARSALEAGLTGRARAQLDALLAKGTVDRRAYLLMVDLEQLEHGESATARAAEAKWLRAAATAPAAPRWRCAHCGTRHDEWAPECSACGTVGRLEWEGTRG